MTPCSVRKKKLISDSANWNVAPTRLLSTGKQPFGIWNVNSPQSQGASAIAILNPSEATARSPLPLPSNRTNGTEYLSTLLGQAFSTRSSSLLTNFKLIVYLISGIDSTEGNLLTGKVEIFAVAFPTWMMLMLSSASIVAVPPL